MMTLYRIGHVRKITTREPDGRAAAFSLIVFMSEDLYADHLHRASVMRDLLRDALSQANRVAVTEPELLFVGEPPGAGIGRISVRISDPLSYVIVPWKPGEAS